MERRDVAITIIGSVLSKQLFLRFEWEPPRRWEAKGRFFASIKAGGSEMWDQELFITYLTELRKHLFAKLTIEEILELAKHEHHRARRFMNLYIIQDKATFHNYYLKRAELEIQFILDQVISALLHENWNMSVKKEIIDLLGIKQDMIVNQVVGYQAREFEKDLLTYIMYWRKRKGDLVNSREEIRYKVEEIMNESTED
ncbi:hypothetical protein [Brevibacillus sp. SIMBA_040]|uniref:hypothetical protein n=1 Tax=unclassified Brevibacillus TaxID=2684853 RepID=UPI00397C774C